MVLLVLKLMNKLKLLDQEILEVLRQIEYCCDTSELLNPKIIEEQKYIQVGYEDKIHSDIDKTLMAEYVKIFLQKNGVDFRLTYNFIDAQDDYINLGKIYGKNIEEIKAKIKTLINELISGKPTNKRKIRKFISINNEEIKQLELLEDKDERKGITVYINIRYDNPKSYNRKGSWKKMYELARDHQTNYNKNFYNYFNTNKKNPLYRNGEFKITKILKLEDNIIVPNIEINIISPRKVKRQLNLT